MRLNRKTNNNDNDNEVMLGVRVLVATKRKLELLADKRGLSLSVIVREAIREYLAANGRRSARC